MHRLLIKVLFSLLVVSSTMPMAGQAQNAPAAPSAAPSLNPTKDAQAAFSPEEIDQMVAPIALYPDQLLAQVFMASTYPLEIVLAERWVSTPDNAALKGDQLAAALEPQTWDPSVKSLVPFPPVLKMMSGQIDWTQRLGDAFLAQEKDVMGSVQRLRRQAQSAGTLKSNEQQTIVVEQQAAAPAPVSPDATQQAPAPQASAPVQSAAPQETIVIQPTNPQVVSVPSYNPSTAYGSWPYPQYPPAYYPYPSYYPIGSALVSGMAFATGAAVVGSLWGWGDCNWGGGNVNINSNRYNNINRSNIQSGRATQLPANASNWRHDPSHRGGVAYRDAGSRQAFQGASRSPANNNFRGFDRGQSGLAGRGARATPAAASAAGRGQAGSAAANRQAGNRAATGQRAAGAGANTSARGQRSGNGAAARTQAAGQRANAGTGAGARQQAGQGRPGAGSNLRAPSSQPRSQAAAFQGMGNGAQTRAQANRGIQSRQASGARSASVGARAGGGGARAAGGGARAGGGGGARGGGRR